MKLQILATFALLLASLSFASIHIAAAADPDVDIICEEVDDKGTIECHEVDELVLVCGDPPDTSIPHCAALDETRQSDYGLELRERFDLPVISTSARIGYGAVTRARIPNGAVIRAW